MRKNHTKLRIFAWIALVLFAIGLLSWCIASIFVGHHTIEPEPPAITAAGMVDPYLKPAPEEPVVAYGFDIEKEDSYLVSEKTFEETVDSMIYDICESYPNVDPEIIRAQVFNESSYDPDAVNSDGSCVGLMQVSTFWHKDRAKRLEVTDFFDAYGNLLLGIDYMSELIAKYGDTTLALMLYSDNHEAAFNAYSSGDVSPYAKAVLSRAETLRNGGE